MPFFQLSRKARAALPDTHSHVHNMQPDSNTLTMLCLASCIIKPQDSLIGGAMHRLVVSDLSPSTYIESWLETRQPKDLSHGAWGQVHHIDLQQVGIG